jgi:AcrR family transcriptional regulator
VATKVARRQSARERLLAASDELFYRNGVHSTGIDAVIAKADVAKGSLYYIFGGKDELVAAYLRGRFETWQQSVDAAQAGADDPDGKILAMRLPTMCRVRDIAAVRSTTPRPRRQAGRRSSRRPGSTVTGFASPFGNGPQTPG